MKKNGMSPSLGPWIFCLAFCCVSSSSVALDRIPLPADRPDLQVFARFLRNTLGVVSTLQSNWFNTLEQGYLHTPSSHTRVFFSFEDICESLLGKSSLKTDDGLFEVGRIAVLINRETPTEHRYEIHHSVCGQPKPVAIENWILFASAKSPLPPVPWQDMTSAFTFRPTDWNDSVWFQQVQVLLPRGESTDIEVMKVIRTRDMGANKTTRWRQELFVFGNPLFTQVEFERDDSIRFYFYNKIFGPSDPTTSVCENIEPVLRTTSRGREFGIESSAFPNGMSLQQFEQCISRIVTSSVNATGSQFRQFIERKFPKSSESEIDFSNQKLVDDFTRILNLLQQGELDEATEALENFRNAARSGDIKDQRSPENP